VLGPTYRVVFAAGDGEVSWSLNFEVWGTEWLILCWSAIRSLDLVSLTDFTCKYHPAYIPSLIALGQTVWAEIGIPKICGRTLVPVRVGWGRGWAPRNMLLHHLYYHAKFGQSMSNRTSVIMEIRQKYYPFQGHSRSLEPTQIDQLLVTSYYWSIVTSLSLTVSVVKGDFGRKSQICPILCV